jgi:hypothetical protein
LITALFTLLGRSEGRAYITRVHLRQTFRQVFPVQQCLIPQLIPQIFAKVPILASRAQVTEETQDCVQTLRVEEQARAHRPWGEQTILHPYTDGLVAYQQNPGGDGDADWPGRRQRIVRHVNEAGSLLRAFGTNRVGDVKYFVHPCEQVSNRRFLSLYRRGCHASDYTAKIGSMLVPLPGWPHASGRGHAPARSA